MSSFTSSSKICQEFESILTTDPKKRRYNVFLSFCAHDKGYFLSSLEEALSLEAGINVFGDIKRFQHVESVLNVIQDCKVAVVLFSKNYTNSSSCIQELEKITQCCRTSDLVVLPVFYQGVGPFYHGDMFGGDTFHDFLDRISMEEISKEEDKLMTWVAAITKANKYLGSRDLIPKPIYRYEHVSITDYIKDIVEHITCVINKNRDFCANSCTPSVKSGVQDVIQLLKQSKSPLIIGIWGMTGIGKSTIAQAIYDQIGLYFEHKSFLKDLGVLWEEQNHDQVLFKGHQHHRVLLVLDNIDKLEQLDVLGLRRSRKWFGEGSKIIITTRDRHLLKKHGIDHIYRVKELDESESLKVFNLAAFSQATTPQEDFSELSRQLVAYSRGLPLALKELGFFLNGEEALKWKNVLKSLKRLSIPAPRLQEALEKSFSDLSDEEKRIFLDIACLFVGMNLNDVKQILNRSTQSAALEISNLEDKSFLTIDENNKLGIHVLLQAMARDIIKRKSSNNTDQPKMYDVFLSFRGEDNRAKFMSHLYSSLQNAGIYVFRDDDEIQRGDHISISLLRAIEQSRTCIVVLSTNYANSRWCMLELEKIMEIGRNRGLVVVPVFYEVAPSEVRHQEGQFGKSFDDLISKNSVDESTKSNWKRELFDIGGIAGFVLIDSRNESADIKNIVEHITRLLDRTELFVAEHPVGVESRVETVTKLLNIENSEDVLLLGIWGMGGMGKTTLAKAIYNQIGSKFEGRSFLLNIRELWETDTNQVSLQQQILCDVYKTTELKILDIESGKNLLKERLAQKRVLLVLDDVNKLDQLKALCGSRKWFGPGSRVIITTRDMRLLRSCRVDLVYTVVEMDERESLELFCWHAFKQPCPPEGFATHSRDVIVYSGGLPLALQVLGSYLSGCETTEWQKVLEKLKCIPHDQVQKKLKVSFDGLKDVTEKQIFFDIACFFIGMDKNDIIQILNGCGYFGDIGIEVLVQQSLVTVDIGNKLRMHDLLRDMGRQIVYEESPFHPEMRSRLWFREEVFDMLSNHKGTEAVKGLALEFPREVCLETKSFKKMNKLRLLRLAGVKLKGDFKYLSGDLKWLYWHGFPETYVPAEFQLGSLVVMELKYSKLKQIWNKSQMLENLKVLNLSHSLDLTETPDFSYMPNLEKLILEDCPSLSTVSHSIGSLHKILLINLTDCTGLRTLPKSIYKLKSLATLILSGCSMLDKLEDLEQMESLTTLIADKTAIPEVPSSLPKMYDVFLSFRGEDNRPRFISHLHSSLHSAGIYAFKDDDGIQRGDQISVSLGKAIEQSRISIVVLSTNYANSRWCMLELEKIMEVGRMNGRVVVPVFYDVDPSEVRHQKGRFGKAFEELLSTISVDESTYSNWRRQLFDIGGIAGFVLVGSRNESAAVKNIVEYVTRLLDRTELFVAEHPVGVEHRVQAATKLLNIQKSEDVLLLGIWGMGGTGKTTLAKAIYNQIGSKFEGRSFVLNIREFWETNTNLVSLQQKVLCDVYKTLTFKIRDIESGKNILKERLSQTSVLLVLDDVNKLDQLKALYGSREWFGPGSRIIITTRDKHLLSSCPVDVVYTIEEMDESESLKLFSWHAFKQSSPKEDFAKHSTDVIAYSGGLPLALEVIGSYLSDCKITTEWDSVLEKLKCIPHDEVQEKLKVSFHGLKHFTEKQIFLDIACFFIGMDKKDAIQILNGCGFFADDGIKVLVERALVTVDNENKLRMHDLLRDMGRQIIFEESPEDPEKRSRLWRHEEVFDILEKRKGTEGVKGLALEFPTRDCLETKAFKKMNKLRLLRLAGVKLKGDFKYLSGDLKWLYWHGFPETYIPAEFQLQSLVVMELKYSKLKQIWNNSQMLKNLKILNLSHSLDLTETPDFSYLPNLEKLVLKNCPSLSTVSQSIGSLQKILLINLRDCAGLRKLPRNIYKLKSLETLILSGCSMIDKLEEDVEQMESLTTLIADKTAITKVPFSIVRLKSIGYISFRGFEGFSRDVFPSLVWSWMSPSNNVISLVQTSVSMSSLGTSKDLQKLRILCVECRTDLQLTEEIARFLEVLKATNCENLEGSASSTTSEISDMYASPFIDDCPGQVCISGSKNHLLIRMGTKCHVSNIAEDSFLQTTDGTSDPSLLPCDDKFNRLIFSCNGCSIIFDVPTMKGSNLKSIMLFVVYYSSPENITSEGCKGMLIINYTKRTVLVYKRDTLTSFEDEDWQSITSNLEPGNKVEVMVVFAKGFFVKKTTLSLLYDEPVDKEMQRCFVVDEEDVIVSGNDDNNVSVSGGDNEAVHRFGKGFTVNRMLITKRADGLYADVMGLVQLILHDPDLPAEVVAEEIHAAEAECDTEQQVPPTDGQLEQQAEVVAPVGIGPALTQILDALRELKVDFVRLEQTVTSRLNAVEVRLEVLEDVITQIPRGSSSD